MSVLLVVLVAVACGSEWVLTPFGSRLRECTVEASSVTSLESGVLLVDGKKHIVPSICHSEMSWKRKNKAASRSLSNVTCSQLPCNDWLDNAGWLTKQTVRGFAGKYIVSQEKHFLLLCFVEIDLLFRCHSFLWSQTIHRKLSSIFLDLKTQVSCCFCALIF
jgi:hypothetical protein